MDKEKLNALNRKITTLPLPEQFEFVIQQFGDKVAFSTSFGYEDQLISHFIFSKKLPITVFTLDTGRLFKETYKVFNQTLEKYGQTIKVYYPDTTDVEKLVSQKGPYSFYQSVENRKECCNIRKVKPLMRALKNVDCWITGLRAEQSDSRQHLDLLTYDTTFNTIKYNPLRDWTLDEVIAAIKKHEIPYNSLHNDGFVSIGCEPCTRAIKPGESFRAGRWWWEDNSKKECGLHAPEQLDEAPVKLNFNKLDS